MKTKVKSFDQVNRMINRKVKPETGIAVVVAVVIILIFLLH